MVLSALMVNVTVLIAGAAALAAVNRLRPVAGRAVAGLAGIPLTAYGAVSTLETMASALAMVFAPAPPPLLMAAGLKPALMLMCL